MLTKESTIFSDRIFLQFLFFFEGLFVISIPPESKNRDPCSVIRDHISSYRGEGPPMHPSSCMYFTLP
jgi:hypothetical protein